ncbi:MAG TPA: histidine--tRNA ligase [Geminicoccaceae bacterium]|nr:histidine--tRNA ligase [Geminicoccaceae bacterium]
MSTLRPVRGTHDIVGEDALRHRKVVETGREVAARYGYVEIATPIFELTEVFARTLGETSDVVTKEMYTFTDRGGETVTLRPEYTAGVARAFISGSLGQNLPIKLFCSGPMFRYERPQKGRLRQFHQIDIEVIGAPEPLADVEVIALGAQILRALGLAEHVRLELNTLGDPESRRVYRERLVSYLSAYRDRLSPDSQVRLERNPLRILDSKDAGDREILKGAPTLDASLNESSRAFFAGVRAGLDALGIAYVINPMLVRGLDYYTHTAFEFTTDRLGAQGAVIAGGRYDGLVAAMGGPDTPGIGWAAGVERLAMLLAATPAPPRPVAVVPIGDGLELPALQLAEELRRAGHSVDFGFHGKVGQRLKRAARQQARFAVLLGEDELAAGQVVLRDLDRGEQETVARSALAARLGQAAGL